MMNMNIVGVERQSSIETEPRTLNNNQIDFAREAALYVVNTRSIEEALTIFTEGLQPVVECGGDSGCGRELINTTMSVGNGNGNAKSPQLNENSHHRNNIREIVSAPF